VTVKLEAVLDQVEGLNRRFVYYLEAQGHIRPTRIKKSRISRRDYSDEDTRRIRAIWQYYQRGFSIQSAVDLVERTEQVLAIAFLQVPMRRLAEALSALADHDRVLAATAVYGESSDLIATIGSPDEGDVYNVLGYLLRQGLLSGPPHVLRVGQMVSSSLASERLAGDGVRMLAYILMKVPAKHLEGVLQQLKDFPGVVEACVIYGETDIIAQVQVGDQAELDDLVLNKIQDIPVVESTRTFIGVGGMHWRRETTQMPAVGTRAV
jgi:DNA-binding Lrp family transcriptional regulator